MNWICALILFFTLTGICSTSTNTAAFYGRAIQVDSGFPYYRNRSADSIADELKAQGFKVVSLYSPDYKLAKACHKRGIQPRFMIGVNFQYLPGDLPKGYEKWKMVLLKSDNTSGGCSYFCENEPEYRAWKKHQINEVLKSGDFVAVDLVEPYLPAYDGPKNEAYGCLCDRCKTAFLRMFPEEKQIPEFNDTNSPNYWKTNKALYKKWIDFRVATVADYLDDLTNGPDGIRQKSPGVAVCTWSIAATVPNPVETLREWEASDGASICAKVHPDAHCVQTDWPDWGDPKLPSNYPLKYKPFVDAIRKVDKKIPITIQTDIGSSARMRRSREWIREFEAASKAAGFCQSIAYEYHIGLYMYTEFPKLVCAQKQGNTVLLIFSKRLDPKIASDLTSYKISSGKITEAKLDGNRVFLSVDGAKKGDTVTVLHCQDDPSVRLAIGELKAVPAPEMHYTIQ